MIELCTMCYGATHHTMICHAWKIIYKLFQTFEYGRRQRFSHNFVIKCRKCRHKIFNWNYALRNYIASVDGTVAWYVPEWNIDTPSSASSWARVSQIFSCTFCWIRRLMPCGMRNVIHIRQISELQTWRITCWCCCQSCRYSNSLSVLSKAVYYDILLTNQALVYLISIWCDMNRLMIQLIQLQSSWHFFYVESLPLLIVVELLLLDGFVQIGWKLELCIWLREIINAAISDHCRCQNLTFARSSNLLILYITCELLSWWAWAFYSLDT